MYGVTLRYQVDFATLTMLGCCMVWFYSYALVSNRLFIKLALTITALTLSFASTSFGIAYSITGYYNSFLSENPQEYEKFKDLFNHFFGIK